VTKVDVHRNNVNQAFRVQTLHGVAQTKIKVEKAQKQIQKRERRLYTLSTSRDVLRKAKCPLSGGVTTRPTAKSKALRYSAPRSLLRTARHYAFAFFGEDSPFFVVVGDFGDFGDFGSFTVVGEPVFFGEPSWLRFSCLAL